MASLDGAYPTDGVSGHISNPGSPVKSVRASANDVVSPHSNDPNAQHTSATTTTQFKVFVGGLPPITTEDSLKACFENYFGSGTVSSTHIMLDRYQNNRSRGFGFVNFHTQEVMEQAVQTHNLVCDEKQIEVKAIDEHRSTSDGKLQIEDRKVFVGALADTVDTEKLRGFFEEAFATPGGSQVVEDAKVMYDPILNRSRRFGYVTFVSQEFVQKAVDNKERNYIDGKWIDVKPINVGGKNAMGKDVKGKGKGKGGKFGKGGYMDQGYGIMGQAMGQAPAQYMIDPATGQYVIAAPAVQPQMMMSYDPYTGQPVYYAMPDPSAGYAPAAAPGAYVARASPY